MQVWVWAWARAGWVRGWVSGLRKGLGIETEIEKWLGVGFLIWIMFRIGVRIIATILTWLGLGI